MFSSRFTLQQESHACQNMSVAMMNLSWCSEDNYFNIISAVLEHVKAHHRRGENKYFKYPYHFSLDSLGGRQKIIVSYNLCTKEIVCI